MQNTNILFTKSKYDRIKNKLSLAKNIIVNNHKTIKHKVKNHVKTFNKNTTSVSTLKNMNKSASVYTITPISEIKSEKVDMCTVTSVAQTSAVSITRNVDEPRLKFKIPKQSSSDPTLTKKVVHVDKKGHLPTIEKPHDIIVNPDRRKHKN